VKLNTSTYLSRLLTFPAVKVYSLPGWQIFLACGSQSIIEATSISCGVASLIGAYYLFNFSYPPETKGAYLFLLLAALVQYQTAAMKCHK